MDTTVTAQTLINNSIARGKDPDSTQWTDAQLLIYLNKGVDFLHKLLIRLQNEIVIETVTVPLSTSQEYELSARLPDFWGMADNGVFFPAIKTPLLPVTYEDKIRNGTTTTASNPESYYLTATHIGLVKIPTAASVALYPSLYCRYFKKNAALTLTSTMPYKNLFNEPLSSFMDHVAVLSTTMPTGELTALYNSLEESSVEIARRRIPI